MSTSVGMGNSVYPPAPGFVFYGAWSALTNYSIGNVVTYNGTSYISIVNNNLNNQPDVNPADWTVLAPQGNSITGATGASGAAVTGATGATGPTGSKTAIVEVDGKWRALYCVESPDTRFEDLIETEIVKSEQAIQIDPLFVEACEPGSLRIRGLHSEGAGLGHSRARIGMVDDLPHVCFTADGHVSEMLQSGSLPICITVTGVRKGHTKRFEVFTREQAQRNNEFWSRATRP